MSSNVIIFTNDTFTHEVLSSSTPVVVDFWAPWCGPCRMLSPLVEKLASDFEGQAKVGKLNIDDYPEIASQYGIQAIPTLVFFQQGQIVDRVVGVLPQSLLNEKLNALLQANEPSSPQAA